MNKTKRKIFDTAMKLFSENGYTETSVEEITAVTGIAKGTLYYHFSKKEDILYFLIDEGMKLLKNSIEIKTAKVDTAVEKIKAIILIQIKIALKYESMITLVLSQMWGKKERNTKCQECMFEYIDVIKKIVEEGMQKNELKKCDPEAVATSIFGLITSCLSYKIMKKNSENVNDVYETFSKTILEGIQIENSID